MRGSLVRLQRLRRLWTVEDSLPSHFEVQRRMRRSRVPDAGIPRAPSASLAPVDSPWRLSIPAEPLDRSPRRAGMRLLPLCVLTAVTASAPQRLSAQFKVERVAPGIYDAIRTEPPGQAFESNAVFIIGDSGVIVVDAQSNLPETRRVLAALRRLTRKPVRTLILTH